MESPDLVGLFVEPIEEVGLTYMVTGGVASTIYGDPRFTRDIDIVLELGSVEVRKLTSAFSDDDFYLPPREALEAETNRIGGGHFNIIHRESTLRADVYLVGDDPLHRWALEHRRRIKVGELSMQLAPVEYVVARKLEYYRASGSERHRTDVQAILEVSRKLVDEEALRSWCEKLDLLELLRDLRGSASGG